MSPPSDEAIFIFRNLHSARSCGKGDRGTVGNQGRKGNKREKGESVKASQASVVPQTNWKQCVWRSNSGTDNGQIKANKNVGLCEPSKEVS